ncbi:hypothetical protein RHSIM_Rhsim07G0071700 [Rhododendron simsii]|uniref:SAC3/GANP/THP3 conserved domain-containing protein n=1 Tax=Rhododendron simsii TaxID=118357 RepID=A0A834GQK8_RHOSS|nr:hypothetical protein RHSIM_Rhsim07G0071700 [Rhododendron simsii]
MESKGHYDHPRRRRRSGMTTTTHSSSSSPSSSREPSSSSSSSLPNSKSQPNPTTRARPSNPNLSNNINISHQDNSTVPHPENTNTQQQEEQDGEEDMSRSSSLVGTCPSMCPVEERLQRERVRDLSVFERLNGSYGKTSSSLAVKKFCRTISTRTIQASDVRPLPVLEETLSYLLNLLDSDEHPFEVVHDFIFDRTRSIRQDLSMQNIINTRVIQMFEKMVKFHVISHHKLRRCSGSLNISSMHHLNMEQLMKVLTSLYHLYEANRKSQSIYENEAEFRSLYVLLHLSSDSKPAGEPLSLWFRHPSPILKSKEMCFARRVLRYYRFGNYKRFIHITATEASYLQYCMVEPHISEVALSLSLSLHSCVCSIYFGAIQNTKTKGLVRALAVSCINYGGYKLYPYPLEDLSKLLMMKESDMDSFCRDCGLETSTDEVGKNFLPTKQTSFSRPKGGVNYCLVGSEFV